MIAQVTALGEPAAFAFSAVLSVSVHHVPLVSSTKTAAALYPRLVQTQQRRHLRRQAQTGEMMLRQMMLQVQIVGALLMLGSRKRMGMKMMLQAQTGEMMLRRQVQMEMMMTTKTRA